ncbi:hypothetical protein GOODEAATRI_014493, partial [Goodea atripinnis]
YVIECPNCGVIYRSRQYWYGNQDPVETVVRTEIQHIWPGVSSMLTRPAYWVPDQDIQSCCECQREFSPRLSIHHCRACGQGVCDDCSQERRPVPSRGWDHPVRVCNGCIQKSGEL